ncbi:SAM-dependent methyltransferase [Pseudanabaena sp. SR411]|uniref:DNA methyltransferase n=1 Tax=Pseudanabaena sp. SR411 TaxID=1980935 RepID=UPI000B99A8BA|nr:DNA methyltransferase [Pseudanabaena sp. SR411]OYQ67572.1 SAM-dependent methyltransferase [Pseudanabaena sp. SR411]
MSNLLQDFVDFHATLQGDEKSESQIFLDRFFQAFHHRGAIEAGAVYEQRVKKGSAKGKTGFADLVWKRPESNGKGGVLIEMKKRGEDLNKHYSQAFQYWTYLVPDRPRYVVLCNFDEFWIYDFNLQVDTPVDTVAIADLPSRSSAFRFMEIAVNTTPIFRNNQVDVTITKAKRLGVLYTDLKARAAKSGFTDLIAQKFILQCVLAMFAENRGLLPKDMFIACIQDCINGASTYDLLGGLFKEMNVKGITPAGRYKGVDYFNGGLFADIHAIELTPEELRTLESAAKENWGMIRPAIFGSIFEATSDSKERHAKGMHYTSEVDIMKIVVPTITRYWEEKIEAANKIEDLNALQLELRAYRVLDPACGSGNFLYLAYQELKRIEMMLLDKVAAMQKTPLVHIDLVTPNQFFGMDINPFAVELARVTLMIARKIAIDKYGLSEPALPLDTLDKNIVCQDALFSDWFEADAIIGNPPFLGGYRMRQDLGDAYAEKVFKKFVDVKGKADFCTYWFRLAHDHITKNGYVGLVGTNSISQGVSREASLQYITQNGGYIHDAISTQAWSGEASVHVSIVNWSKQKLKEVKLDHALVSFISSSLKENTDVVNAVKLQSNMNYCFQAIEPSAKGFFISEVEVNLWKKGNPKNENVLKLLVSADDLTKEVNGFPSRWIIDFNDMSLEEASNYKLPFEHVKKFVKPERDKNKELSRRELWWLHGRSRPAMRKALESLKCYFAVPAHSKWFMFIPCKTDWLPNNSVKVVTSDDFYMLGILTSKVHRLWVKAQSSTLEDRTRYTNTTCFETFPFPQNKTSPLVAKIRAAMQELHQYRTEQMESKQWGITKLYNEYFHEPASQLYKLHAKLDKLVMQLYGFSDSDDLLEKLLHLNQEIANMSNESITDE